MNELPSKIEKTIETNEGYEIDKRDDKLIEELMDGFNALIDYLTEREQL
jgi:hypothetical protein